MSDRERLSGYVGLWWEAIDEFTTLLEELDEADWTRPTDLAGWNVHALAAHTAHLESVLAGGPEETVDVGLPEHVTGLMGLYTEQGVVARRDRTPDELINEIRSATTIRHTELLADPPDDATAVPERIFAGIGWSWDRLLRNRVVDVWMHEQDVRRAVGRPGNLDTGPAKHTADYLGEAFGVVVGKRVAPPTGTCAVLAVAGSPTRAVEVDESGRAVTLPDAPTAPDVVLEMDREAFIVIAGGRRWPDDKTFSVLGDAELGRKILDAMAVTP
jgi:uncharacterized protein (TIGR03083 family)